MAIPNQHQLQTINQVVESLSSSECRSLLYLCGYEDTNNSSAYVKDILTSKVMSYEDGHLFLVELMLHLKRFDILKKVLKTSRADVETALKCRQVLPRFRILMVNINEDMASEDVRSMKFLLSRTLPREKMEKAKNFLDVSIELEKLDLISPERVDLLEQCLRNISRADLAENVAKYKMLGENTLYFYHCKLQHPKDILVNSKGLELHVRASLNMAPIPYSKQDKNSPFLILIPLDWYKFGTNSRGACVIIDCVGNDGDMLERTFKALHFHVDLYKWLTVNETLSVLREVFRQRENHGRDGFACCIISRGTESRLLCTDSSDSTGLRLDSIRQLFTADACPMLAGKPKMFFIQRYSVPEFQSCAKMSHQDEDLETDGWDGITTYGYIPAEADVFWSHCWTDEHQLEQGHHSSVYLNALKEALHKGQRRKNKLIDVHTEVNAVIFEHNKRNPGKSYHIDLKHTLRKDLYF
ncbi:CASP8 and FADD-like apoptosis regulator Caspase -like protein [Channa argus]|uniref:CASP8 and FADD-like apoptosis regulator Caspase-like protein n=1 Tax=Channa argus TaxID=215402 RepID=A0A6G1PXJ9_CHAAH|nr:CASP8 and FADD-like apoptosis regulator Caspase -like protein [Channa argus]